MKNNYKEINKAGIELGLDLLQAKSLMQGIHKGDYDFYIAGYYFCCSDVLSECRTSGLKYIGNVCDEYHVFDAKR